MNVEICEVPRESLLDPQAVVSADFQDSYRTALTRPASVSDLFLAVFDHHPMWMKGLLIVRNALARLFGLEAPTARQILHPAGAGLYQVGDTIGVWPIFAMTDTELVVGRDNPHLDFRLSILRQDTGPKISLVVSTICNVRNRFGRPYLWVITPFHRWGVQRLMAEAVRAGRL